MGSFADLLLVSQFVGCGGGDDSAPWPPLAPVAQIRVHHRGDPDVVLRGPDLRSATDVLGRCVPLAGDPPVMGPGPAGSYGYWLFVTDTTGREWPASVYRDETLDVFHERDGYLSAVRRRDLSCPGLLDALGLPPGWGRVPPEEGER